MKNTNILSGVLFSSLSILLATGTTGCALSVEADVPEIEVTKSDIAFEGVPIGAVLGDVSMTKSFSQKHSALELPEGLTTEVHAIGVTLKAKSGIKDLSFIRMLRVTMADEKNPGAAIELISYQADAAKPAGDTLVMVSANPVNALDQWKTDSAMFTVDVAGTLPTENWTADLVMRFGGSIKYSR
jgi:hypothetical protein